MSRLLAVVVTYYPEEAQLLRNIGSFLDDVDRLVIWENTPAVQAASCRFIHHPKIIYMGMGNNVGIAKALDKVLSYAVEKKYDYLLTMDQDSDWENFHWYKTVIVDNSDVPEALFGPVRTIQSVEAHRVECDNESSALTISVPAGIESYPQFVDNSIENQKFKLIQVTDEKGNAEEGIESRIRLIPTMNLITSGMLAKTSLLQRLGGYWQELFVDGIDEELVCRAKVQGVPSYFVEGTVFHHQLGYPIRKRFFGKAYTVPGYSEARLYDRYRSLCLLKARFPLTRYPAADYPEIAGVLSRLKYDWEKTAPVRILLGADHRLAKLRAIWKGSRDGKKAARRLSGK